MCGIAGHINLHGQPVQKQSMQIMGDAIAHRGPDGHGIWCERNIGFAHRRLSIIDLSELAHQPMHSQDDRYILVFNGMIYNFQELHSELEALGCKFRSTSDTEVLLNALIQWGPHVISRLNGMFAFALWDRKTQKLTLGRDRYGVKPLYYTQNSTNISFGSEIKAIVANPANRTELDKEGLLEYFTFQNLFTDKTLFKNIKLFPAGHFAELQLNDQNPELSFTKYWDFHFCEPERPKKHEEYIEEVDRLFVQAVNRQLISDVDVGSYLSGGIDSGSITAIASRHRENFNTFTCGFDLSSASGMELSFDERKPARALSERFNTKHHEVELRSGDMERILPSLAYHLEEPRVGQSYPNFYVAELASKKVKVVLSGSGGDELFGGYPWRYYRAAISDNFEHFAQQYYLIWQRLLTRAEIARLFAPIWQDVKHIDTMEIFRNVFAHHDNQLNKPEDYINHSLYFESKTFLHGLLVVEDKLSMAHGLESRVPFLDNDLVDFAMQCPVNLKLNNLAQSLNINENDTYGKNSKFVQKTADGKQILRDAMAVYNLEDIIKANKQGFSAPDASWFKGSSIDFVKRYLFAKNTRLQEFLDTNVLAELVGEHLQGKKNRRLLIWSLLNFEAFLQKHI